MSNTVLDDTQLERLWDKMLNTFQLRGGSPMYLHKIRIYNSSNIFYFYFYSSSATAVTSLSTMKDYISPAQPIVHEQVGVAYKLGTLWSMGSATITIMYTTGSTSTFTITYGYTTEDTVQQI